MPPCIITGNKTRVCQINAYVLDSGIGLRVDVKTDEIRVARLPLVSR
jgi:hypothetical protein